MRVAPALLMAVVLTACGAAEQPSAAQPNETSSATTVTRPPACTSAGSYGETHYRVCFRPREDRPTNGSIEVRRDGSWRDLRVRLADRKPGQPIVGHWVWAAPSPDGRFLVAQWSAECEVPVAYIASLVDRKAVPAATDRYGAQRSVALGWTTDGRAIVDFGDDACGGAELRGVHLIGPGDRPVFWKPAGTVSRSLRPRPAT